MSGEADPSGMIFRRRQAIGPVTDPKRSPDFDVRMGGMKFMRRRLVAAGLALTMALAAASGSAAAQRQAGPGRGRCRA